MTCSTLAVGACPASSGSDRGSLSHGKEIVRTDGAVQEPQSAAVGAISRTLFGALPYYRPSPANSSLHVSVTAPASVNVAVNIRTWYGTTLTILDSSHDRTWCRRRASNDICFLPLPFLPAQLADKWTVVASKQSGAQATVGLVVTFAKP